MSSRLFSIDYKTDKYNIKRFNILSGFTVEYNDIHIEKLEKNLNNCVDSKIYEINYCFEGRFECVLQDGTITYM
ncbi:MAG: AraC family transcriptional regulator, partial [Tissierellia bacterium]|nr:AraC family transcriptional regulator [Tissierellia bacterium]